MITTTRQTLLNILLCTVIIVLMVQNFLLGRKIDEYLERIRILENKIGQILGVREGDFVSPFIALDMDSSFVVIDPKEGARKKLFLIFTASCGACGENMDQWNQLASALPTTEHVVYGISLDSLYRIKNYMNQVYLGFPTYSISNDFSIVRRYKFQSFPQTVLIDQSGIVTKVWTGILTEEMRAEILESL